VVPDVPEEVTGEAKLAATESGCAPGRPTRNGWARLLKRGVSIDLEHGPNFHDAHSSPRIMKVISR